jgi:hypothetical protein
MLCEHNYSIDLRTHVYQPAALCLRWWLQHSQSITGGIGCRAFSLRQGAQGTPGRCQPPGQAIALRCQHAPALLCQFFCCEFDFILQESSVRTLFSSFGKVEDVRTKLFTTNARGPQVGRSISFFLKPQGLSSSAPVYHVVFEKSKSVEACVGQRGQKPTPVAAERPRGMQSLSFCQSVLDYQNGSGSMGTHGLT